MGCQQIKGNVSILTAHFMALERVNEKPVGLNFLHSIDQKTFSYLAGPVGPTNFASWSILKLQRMTYLCVNLIVCIFIELHHIFHLERSSYKSKRNLFKIQTQPYLQFKFKAKHLQRPPSIASSFLEKDCAVANIKRLNPDLYFALSSSNRLHHCCNSLFFSLSVFVAHQISVILPEALA